MDIFEQCIGVRAHWRHCAKGCLLAVSIVCGSSNSSKETTDFSRMLASKLLLCSVLLIFKCHLVF